MAHRQTTNDWSDTLQGESHALSADQPMLVIDDETSQSQAWLVTQGFVNLFAVQIVAGEITGRRHFVARIETDGLLCAIPTHSPLPTDHGAPSHGEYPHGEYPHGEYQLGLCAVGSMDCRVLPFNADRLDQAEASQTEHIATLIDGWVNDLSNTLDSGSNHWPEYVAIPGSEIKLAAGKALYGHGERLCWVKATDDCAATLLQPNGQTETDAWQPLTARSSVQAPENTREDILVQCCDSNQLIREQTIGQALAAYHQRFMPQLADVLQRDEQGLIEQTTQRAHTAEQAIQHSFAALADVVGSDSVQLAEGHRPSSSPSAMVMACEQVARYLNVHIQPVEDDTDTSTAVIEPQHALERHLQKTQLRHRNVLLRDDWWQHDNGPLIGFQEDGSPVALLPLKGGGYKCVQQGQTQPIDQTLALTLRAEAYTIYWSLPDRSLSFWKLMRGTAQGLQSDLRWIIGMGVAAALLALLTPIASGMLIEHILPAASVHLMWQVIAGLVVAAFAAAAFEFTKSIAMLRLEGRIDWRFQAAIFDRLLRLPTPFFKRYTSGDLGDRVLSIQTIRQILSANVTSSVLGMIFSSMSFLLLFYYSWKLALIALALMLLVIGVTLFWSLLQLRYDRLRIARQGEVEGLVLQLIIGIGKLRVAAAQSRALAVWAHAFARQKRYFNAAQAWQNRQEVFQSVFPLLANLAIYAGVVWVLKTDAQQAQLFSLTGDAEAQASIFSTGDFIAFNAAFGQLLAAMTTLALAVSRALVVIPMYERVQPILKSPSESAHNRQSPGQLRGDIELSQLHFRYHGDEHDDGQNNGHGHGHGYGHGYGPWVIENLSLNIRAGEFIAIVGSSGSGKSTLLRLLLGFETPQQGELFFDNKASSTLDIQALRQQIGVVLQNGRIMGGSIYKNIVGNHKLSVDDAWRAARQVGLDADIEAMPMGMHTVLMEGAGTLSGGQRQRIMLARALVVQPRILLLDEATSALDNRTQSTVTRSLQQLNITRIVIAHRLSTIRHADRIVVLEQGKIVQCGDYATLVAEAGPFATLAQRQTL